MTDIFQVVHYDTLELIPPSELEPRHIVLRTNRSALPTYKFVRAPATMNELDYRADCGEPVVRMENGTLALINFSNMIGVHAVKYTKFIEMWFYFDRSSVMFKIFGDSEDAILQTAVYFASLKVCEERTIISKYFAFQRGMSFDTTHAEQLALLLDAAPAKKIKIEYSVLGPILSAVLATRPYPIDLDLARSILNFDVFAEHLQGRTSSFGSLAMKYDIETAVGDIRRLSDHVHVFDHLDIFRLPEELLLKLLSDPTKSISIHFDGDTGDDIDWSAVDIVPKHIAVHGIGNVQFWHRIAELGHLESLKLMSKVTPAPTDVGEALIRAVSANKNLKVLELHKNRSVWDSCLEDLLRNLETHEGLRVLSMRDYPTELDPGFSWLKQLLRRNLRFKIISREHSNYSDYFSSWDPCHWSMDREMLHICAVNRFFLGSKRLTQEAPSSRVSLFGAALTNPGNRDIQRIGLLLAEHVDLFCEILHERTHEQVRAPPQVATRASPRPKRARNS